MAPQILYKLPSKDSEADIFACRIINFIIIIESHPFT